MKNLLFLLLCSLILGHAFAQDGANKNIPQKVLNAFQSAYKDAASVDWEKKGASFEVEYKAGMLDHTILYDKNGNELYHKEDVETNALPAAVSGSLNAKYPNNAVTEAEKLNAKGKVTYSVDIKTASGEKREIHLTEKGKIVSDRVD